MNELTETTLKRPLDQSQIGQDVAALNGLLGMLNNPAITGAKSPPPPEARSKAVVQADPPLTGEALDNKVEEILTKLEPMKASVPLPISVARKTATRIMFTGRLGAGKDYLADKIGAKVIGFADPIYLLATHFFGVPVSATQNKDLPGMRAFLQAAGNWGRGEINEQHPLTPARGLFEAAIRSQMSLLPRCSVDWSQFGRNQEIWIDSLLAAVEASDAGLIAVTNVRYENEFKALQEAGFTHYHVMLSPGTWKQRLAEKKLTPESPECRNMSEKLAAAMDADVIRKLSAAKAGARLRVVWNDSAPQLSPRLYSTSQFVAECSLPAQFAVTGE